MIFRSLSNNDEKIYVVNKALSRYLLTNMRLPCPSDITLYNDDPDYAKELRSYSGDCEVLDSRFSNGDYIAGGVPTKELGLPTEYTLDAWDSKVVYVVNKYLFHVIKGKIWSG